MTYLLAFVAGVVSTLVFHQGVVALLHRAHLYRRPPFDRTPTRPLGVPQIVSTAFWAGVWAVVLLALLGRWSEGWAYWLSWVVAGAVAPTLVALFVVLPLRGKRPDRRIAVGGVLVNAVWGFGVALLLRLFALGA